jgi:hypothetical protein
MTNKRTDLSRRSSKIFRVVLISTFVLAAAAGVGGARPSQMQ